MENINQNTIIEISMNIPGYILKEELKILLSWLKKFNPNDNLTIVEVGSFMGRSASLFAQYFKNGKIFCIDFWNGYCDGFNNLLISKNIKNNIKEIKKFRDFFVENNFPIIKKTNSLKNFKNYTKNYKNIIPLKLKSPDDLSFWEEKVDIFFLDALHKNPNDWDNIEFWLKFMKNNSIFMGHDYNKEQFPDVIENVHRLEKILNKKATIGYSLWKFDL